MGPVAQPLWQAGVVSARQRRPRATHSQEGRAAQGRAWLHAAQGKRKAGRGLDALWTHVGIQLRPRLAERLEVGGGDEVGVDVVEHGEVLEDDGDHEIEEDEGADDLEGRG